MSENIQHVGAALTWFHDFSKRLAKAEQDLGLAKGSLTLSDPDVSGPDGVDPEFEQANDAGTGVFFRLTTTLTDSVDVVLTTTVTLSNGDTDVDTVTIKIRS